MVENCRRSDNFRRESGRLSLRANEIVAFSDIRNNLICFSVRLSPQRQFSTTLLRAIRAVCGFPDPFPPVPAIVAYRGSRLYAKRPRCIHEPTRTLLLSCAQVPPSVYACACVCVCSCLLRPLSCTILCRNDSTLDHSDTLH